MESKDSNTKDRVKKEYLRNPSIELVGYLLRETKETLRVKSVRIGKIDGKLDKVVNEDRVYKVVDDNKFVKVFVDAGALREYNELSTSAQRLMTAIIEGLTYNQDWFYYNPIKLSRDSNIGEHNISVYMNELVEKEWIYRSSEKRKYWINICYICFGDREEIYREYQLTSR